MEVQEKKVWRCRKNHFIFFFFTSQPNFDLGPWLFNSKTTSFFTEN